MDRWTLTCPESCKDAQQRCWIAGNVIMSDMHILVAKSELEMSAMDVNNAFAMELRSSEVFKVIPVESQVGDSAADAVAEKCACNERCAGWVQNTTLARCLEPGIQSVESSGQVVSRFQGTFQTEVRRTNVRNNGVGSKRVASRSLILFGDMVMPSEQPRHQGNIWNRESIASVLVDRSTSRDGTADREETNTTSDVQCGPVVKRVPEAQRGNARYARSARRVSWPPNPAGVA